MMRRNHLLSPLLFLVLPLFSLVGPGIGATESYQDLARVRSVSRQGVRMARLGQDEPGLLAGLSRYALDSGDASTAVRLALGSYRHDASAGTLTLYPLLLDILGATGDTAERTRRFMAIIDGLTPLDRQVRDPDLRPRIPNLAPGSGTEAEASRTAFVYRGLTDLWLQDRQDLLGNPADWLAEPAGPHPGPHKDTGQEPKAFLTPPAIWEQVLFQALGEIRLPRSDAHRALAAALLAFQARPDHGILQDQATRMATWWELLGTRAPWMLQGLDMEASGALGALGHLPRDLLAVLEFKALVARQDHARAWGRFLAWTSEPEADPVESSVRKVLSLAINSDWGVQGLLRDIFDAGRLSGQVTQTARILEALGPGLPGADGTYALELASRLWRAAGQGEAERRVLERLHQEVLGRDGASILAPADHQRILWYVVRMRIETSGFPLDPALAPLVRDPVYFSDLLDPLLVAELARGPASGKARRLLDWSREWKPALEPRLYWKAQASAAALLGGEEGERIWEEVYAQDQNLYYHGAAAWFLRRPPETGRLLARQEAALALPRPALDPRDGARVTAHSALLPHGLARWASGPLLAFRRSLDSATLDGLGRRYQEADLLTLSLRFLESRRAVHGHPAALEDLARMYPRPWNDLTVKATADHGAFPHLLHSVMRTESLFDPRARSSAGALGLAQFMPATAQEVSRALGKPDMDVFLPEDAIPMAAAYLTRLWRAGSNWSWALGAYNAGIGRMRTLERRLPADQFLFNESLEITETRDYIRRNIESVMVYWYLYGAAASPDDLLKAFFGGKE